MACPYLLTEFIATSVLLYSNVTVN